jgi:tetratricopeptide (TPR) repeat protein
MENAFTSYIEDVLTPACPRVEVGITVGTGFLIDSGLVATAAHVVDKIRPGEDVICCFPQKTDERRVKATVAQCDSGDHALLKLHERITDRSSVALASDSEVQSFASYAALCEFLAYGYPVAAKGAGILVRGEVYLWRAVDSNRKPALQLHCESVAAGMATPVHGFSGSPVLVEQKVVGHLWRIIEDPQTPGRPAYGLVYASPAAGLLAMLNGKRSVMGDTDATKRVAWASADASRQPTVETTPAEAVSNGMLQMLSKIGSAKTPLEVDEVYKTWQKSRLPKAIGLAHAAERLINIGAPNDALGLLSDGGNSLRMRQLRALALDRAGRREESLSILLEIQQEEGDYAESRGLLGGRYKQQWLDTDNKDFLIAAYETYADAYEKTLDSYPGINAAATALYLGKSEESRRIAREVVERLMSVPEKLVGKQWLLATVAEGHLLLGNLDDARVWYKKAIDADPQAKDSITVMRRQASRNLLALNLPVDALENALA